MPDGTTTNEYWRGGFADGLSPKHWIVGIADGQTLEFEQFADDLMRCAQSSVNFSPAVADIFEWCQLVLRATSRMSDRATYGGRVITIIL